MSSDQCDGCRRCCCCCRLPHPPPPHPPPPAQTAEAVVQKKLYAEASIEALGAMFEAEDEAAAREAQLEKMQTELPIKVPHGPFTPES